MRGAIASAPVRLAGRIGPGRQAVTTALADPGGARHRPPAEAIGHAVRFASRFLPSPRHVDEVPAVCGVAVGHDTAWQ